MILYSGIITLDFNPSTDVLETSMPDIRQFALSEVRFCLDLIVSTIRNYHIKNLLLDSSNSLIEVGADAYRDLATQFAVDLMTTRLKKLARVGTTDANREENVASVSAELTQNVNLSIVFKTFTNKAEALAWLLE